MDLDITGLSEAAQEHVLSTFHGESLSNPPKYPAELVWGMVHDAFIAGAKFVATAKVNVV
jgi:hypothetical protein